ncbi:MAG TPA: DUF1990 family protein [Rubricoccaceae bacterium]|nr:DUF1990 family protein [Rubricoccaceae bacterium]
MLGGLAVLGGVALAVGLWRRWGFPVRHRVREVDELTGQPEPLPADCPPEETPVQAPEDGAGAAFHRRYWVDIEGATLSAEALMAKVQADPGAFSPVEIARFEKTKGEEGQLAVGDEFFIHITSPWNGPVRTTRVTPTSFTFCTLEGHLEAGQIRFSLKPHLTDPDVLRFTIESWARSRDALVDFAYDKLLVARTAQQAMWTFYCERIVEASGGRRRGDIEVVTERAPAPDEDEGA